MKTLLLLAKVCAVTTIALIGTALFGGWLMDIGHPGGEARGIPFAANVIRSAPYVYFLSILGALLWKKE